MNVIRIIAFSALIGLAPGADLHRVEIKEINTTIQQTPRYQVSGLKDKPFDPRYWLEIEAELEVESLTDTEFIPELRTNWFAIVRAIDKTAPGGKKNVMLTGEITFQNIRAKDGEAHLIAFIGPDTLEKLTGEDRPNEGDVEGIALTVSGPGVASEGSRAAGLEKATAKEQTRWWAKSMYETVAEAIVAKDRTPFAPLWWDRYPTEKVD
ncbi:Amuc_1102 family pilus-like protein [Haloferula sp. A504]|uniref:Amuc_1102 family pilus-like protein n=1 Tax=Haloferula sp. A504 TaxID=3373601 RepID=UPI0031BE09C0|nr:hypothetical protein [Verrucomicrobiaceae bacterium E54]